ALALRSAISASISGSRSAAAVRCLASGADCSRRWALERSVTSSLSSRTGSISAMVAMSALLAASVLGALSWGRRRTRGLVPEGDASPVEVVRRHLDRHPVADERPDAVFPHP